MRLIKDRWNALKQFSLYALYQECDRRKYDFGDDDELLTYLVRVSDERLDQMVLLEKDPVITRDALIPSLCYDLLLENVELRKMCNQYQLRVLLLYKGMSPSPPGKEFMTGSKQ